MRWVYKGGYLPQHTSGKGAWGSAVSSSTTDPRSFASSIHSISKHKEFLFHSWTRLLKPSLIPTPKCTLLTVSYHILKISQNVSGPNIQRAHADYILSHSGYRDELEVSKRV